MTKITLLAIFCLCGAGCSIPRSIAEGGPTGNHSIDQSSKVMILSIADGQEQGQSIAYGSGQGMASAIRKVLASHNVPVSMTATSSLRDGIDEARRAGFDYTLKCTITLWEDNATAWSGNGDKLNISVEVYDSKSRELIGAATHKRVATGETLLPGSPDRFIDEVATGALGKIYGWSDQKRSRPIVAAAGVSDSTRNPPQALSDAEAMNTELRRLAKESLDSGNQKAAKEYLDMIVPESSQH
jgi:hypothetical protein